MGLERWHEGWILLVREVFMATSALIPVSEYLRTSYRPDCDYVDGEVQERNLGEQDHSELQTTLILLLRTPQNSPHIWVNTELRVQVKPERFRVPDVCVRRADAPSEQIVTTPPLLCIEVLSPEDQFSRMRTRIRDYIEMGVLEVWVVDPATRTVSVARGMDTVEHGDGELVVPTTPVTLKLETLFQALDRTR
jgi:Uma2 family endonuclease